MNKPLLWVGAAMAALGAALFLVFVLPRIGAANAVSMLPNGEVAGGAPLFAVAVSSLGLAGGLAMMGIGLGRWKRPRPSPIDGSPEA